MFRTSGPTARQMRTLWRMAERPAVTARARRREVGSSASARSLLLTVLGEFVHPRARAGLDRDPAGGARRPRRRGEVGPPGPDPDRGRGAAHLHPARPAGALGADARRRAAARGGHPRASTASCASAHPWDGRWLVLSVPIPETQRQLRHRLRTRLTWLGLGSPTSGLWVTPDATKADEVHAVVRDLGLETLAFAWVGPGQRHRRRAAGCSPTPGTSRTSRTATSSFLGRLRGPARRHPGGGVRRAGRDGPGVAALPVPRPGPARASCSTTTGPALGRPRRSTTGTPLAPAGAGRVGPDGPGRGTAGLNDAGRRTLLAGSYAPSRAVPETAIVVVERSQP